MSIRTGEDLVNQAIQKIVPGSKAMQASAMNDLSILTKRGVLLDVLVDENGNPLFMPGSTEIGSGTIA